MSFTEKADFLLRKAQNFLIELSRERGLQIRWTAEYFEAFYDYMFANFVETFEDSDSDYDFGEEEQNSTGV